MDALAPGRRGIPAPDGSHPGFPGTPAWPVPKRRAAFPVENRRCVPAIAPRHRVWEVRGLPGLPCGHGAPKGSAPKRGIAIMKGRGRRWGRWLLAVPFSPIDPGAGLPPPPTRTILPGTVLPGTVLPGTVLPGSVAGILAGTLPCVNAGFARGTGCGAAGRGAAGLGAAGLGAARLLGALAWLAAFSSAVFAACCPLPVARRRWRSA
jgi:hypothetical protein